MTKILALIASLLLTTSVYAADAPAADATADKEASATTDSTAPADKDMKKDDKKPADEAKK
jgi:hypothetical protein